MKAVHLVVMGVSGCGKSQAGLKIAQGLGVPLVEGDDFHPAANIAKMRRGEPPTDADRAGWLGRLGEELAARPAGAVLACSALKRAYRERLRAAVPGLRFVHLALTQAEALARVTGRTDHFYPPSLVASQFEALEDPAAEPGVLAVDATQRVETLAEGALAWLRRA